jgi:hypothetical protein
MKTKKKNPTKRGEKKKAKRVREEQKERGGRMALLF